MWCLTSVRKGKIKQTNKYFQVIFFENRFNGRVIYHEEGTSV